MNGSKQARPVSRSPWRALGWSALALGALGACSSTPEAEGPPLPLHLAIVPVEVVASAAPQEGKDAPSLVQELDRDAVSRSVGRILAGRGFSRVTLLPQPAEDAGPVPDEYWLGQAKSIQADVLMTGKLVYSPAIEGARNEKFWLNLPLFLLGGPMCYFINDRTYEAEALLQAEFFDVSVDHDRLDAAWAYLPLPLQAEFQGTTLDFVDRAKGSPGSYALSILVPAGLLAKSNEQVQSRVEKAAMAGLGEDLLQKVVAQRSLFMGNRILASFQVDSEHEGTRVSWKSPGVVAVNVPVQELRGSRGIRGYSILDESGEVLVSEDLEDVRPEEGGLHWIREEMSVPREAQFVRLRVEDMRTNSRTYTFRIESN